MLCFCRCVFVLVLSSLCSYLPHFLHTNFSVYAFLPPLMPLSYLSLLSPPLFPFLHTPSFALSYSFLYPFILLSSFVLPPSCLPFFYFLLHPYPCRLRACQKHWRRGEERLWQGRRRGGQGAGTRLQVTVVLWVCVSKCV